MIALYARKNMVAGYFALTFHHPVMAICHVIVLLKEKSVGEKLMNIKKILYIILGCIGVVWVQWERLFLCLLSRF